LLTSRQLAEGAVRQLAQAHSSQHVQDQPAVAGGRPPKQSQPTNAAHHGQVEDRGREGAVDLTKLRHVADLPATAVQSVRAVTEHLHLSRPGRQQAEHDLQEGALTGSIRAQQRGSFAGLQVAAGVQQDHLLVVTSPDLVEQKGRPRASGSSGRA
jgi:hypothetical protein